MTPKEILTKCGLCLLAILTGAIAYYSIPVSDDLLYALPYRSYLTDESDFPGISPWLDFCITHHFSINGRLGDKFMPLIMLLPRLVYSIIFALAFWIIFVMTCRLTYGGNKIFRHLGSVAVASMVVLIIPSYDCIFSRCIFVNYTISAAISLTYISYYIQTKRASACNSLLLFILSVILGSWHEYFSISLIVASIFSYYKCHQFRTSKNKYMIIGLLIGLMFILSSYGFYRRFDTIQSSDGLFGFYHWISAIWFAILVLIAVLILFTFNQRLISKTGSVLITAFLIIVIITMIINYLTRSTARFGWLPNILAIPILLKIMYRFKLSNKILRFFMLAITGLAIFNLSATLYWQRFLWVEHQKVIHDFKKANGNTVYYDLQLPGYAHLMTFGKIEELVYYSAESDLFGQFYLGEKKDLRVVPVELRHIDPNLGDSIENDFYITPKGNLLKKKNIDSPERFYIEYSDDNGHIIKRDALCTPFTSHSGEKWIFIRPRYFSWEKEAGISHPIQLISHPPYAVQPCP